MSNICQTNTQHKSLAVYVFAHHKKRFQTYGPTDGPTDQEMDQWTNRRMDAPSHRVMALDQKEKEGITDMRNTISKGGFSLCKNYL